MLLLAPVDCTKVHLIDPGVYFIWTFIPAFTHLCTCAWAANGGRGVRESKEIDKVGNFTSMKFTVDDSRMSTNKNF